MNGIEAGLAKNNNIVISSNNDSNDNNADENQSNHLQLHLLKLGANMSSVQQLNDVGKHYCSI